MNFRDRASVPEFWEYNKGPKREDDTLEEPVPVRLSWPLFPNFSQRLSPLSYNQNMMLR